MCSSKKPQNHIIHYTCRSERPHGAPPALGPSCLLQLPFFQTRSHQRQKLPGMYVLLHHHYTATWIHPLPSLPFSPSPPLHPLPSPPFPSPLFPSPPYVCRFELLLPSERHRPVYIHLAGTGDHVSTHTYTHTYHVTSFP